MTLQTKHDFNKWLKSVKPFINVKNVAGACNVHQQALSAFIGGNLSALGIDDLKIIYKFIHYGFNQDLHNFNMGKVDH